MSQNESAEVQQLESAMDEHRGDLQSGTPRSRGQKPPKPKAPRATQAVQKKPIAKTDAYEAMSRRRKVQSRRLRGLSYAEIAHDLSVSESTVKGDLDYLRKAAKDAIDTFQQQQQQGDALAVYDELAAKAWEEYEDAVDEEGGPMTTARLKCLDLVRSIQNDKMKALHDCGLLEKVPDKVEHKVAYQLPWNPQVKHAAAMAMLQSALTPQLAAPEPEYIDVPAEAEVEVKTE